MKKWMRFYTLALSVLCLALSGCARLNADNSPTVVSLLASKTPTTAAPSPTALPPTETLAPTVTLAPVDTATAPAPTATHVPSGNVHATTNVLSLNLRSGPGTVFSIKSKAEKGATFDVVGKAPGNDWVLVKKANGGTGWVSLDFLLLQGALEDVPLAPVDFARTVTGRVIDTGGAPVAGIIMAVSIKSDLYSSPRTEATTDAGGMFYAYLPKNMGGTWYMGQVGIACNSPVATANCLLPGSVTPKPFILILSSGNPKLVTFNYLPQ